MNGYSIMYIETKIGIFKENDKKNNRKKSKTPEHHTFINIDIYIYI